MWIVSRTEYGAFSEPSPWVLGKFDNYEAVEFFMTDLAAKLNVELNSDMGIDFEITDSDNGYEYSVSYEVISLNDLRLNPTLAQVDIPDERVEDVGEDIVEDED